MSGYTIFLDKCEAEKNSGGSMCT